MKKRQWIVLLAAATTLAVVAQTAIRPAHFTGKSHHIAMDLQAPDALIVSRSLSQLPHDLLAVPLLHDTLTEDFAFYYENNPDRLSLVGTLKRIAYEHDVSLSDHLVADMLDEPAEVMLWKGQGGKLDHYLVAMQRGELARLMELAGRLAALDGQLKKAGDLTLADGSSQPVYVLSYGADQQLFFTARGDRLLLATDADLILGSDTAGEGAAAATGDAADAAAAVSTSAGAAASPAASSGPQQSDEARASQLAHQTIIAGLLQDDPGKDPYLTRFQLDPAKAKHSIVVSAEYLTFGYGDLFKGISALRFDFGDGQWSTWGRFTSAWVAAPASSLWAHAPTNAALCGSAPLEWSRLAGALADTTADPLRSQIFVSALNAPIAVCWYASAHYYTPLFLAQIDARGAPGDYDDFLASLFQTAIRSTKDDGPMVSRPLGRTGKAWQRHISSIYGDESDKDGNTFFEPALARAGDIVLFSPDRRLVDKALQVAAKDYPALADSLPAGAPAVYAQPAELASLLQADLMASLPQQTEPVFFEAASKHLLPRLQALAKYPAFSLDYPAGALPAGGGWQKLDWKVRQ